MSKIQNKKHSSIYTILGKIGDILLWPVLIISLFSSFFMLVQRQQNKVTSVFGYSFVNVLSKSMENEGFLVGDTVLTKKIDKRDVQLGDVIAFYYKGNSLSFSNFELVMEYNYQEGTKDVNYDKTNIRYGVNLSDRVVNDMNEAENIKKAQENKSRIYFHRVIGIYIDDSGNLYYKTKGSNNSASDSVTYADLLVGKYVYTPVVVRRAVSFCASSLGMILLVCFPLSLLVLMQCLSLIEQISIISTEKKLMSGVLSYKDEELRKELKSDQIEQYNKVYYYYTAPPEEKEDVKKFLWEDLYVSPILPDKQKQELLLLNKSLDILKDSNEGYWDFWINNSKGASKKQMIKLKHKAISEDVKKDKPQTQNEVIKNEKPKPQDEKITIGKPKETKPSVLEQKTERKVKYPPQKK